MSFATEVFTEKEAGEHRHSAQLALLLLEFLSVSPGNVYDFGCGDGFYLKMIQDRLPARFPYFRNVGVEGSATIPCKFNPYIIHPVDVAAPICLGPPGHVVCIEVAEHIASARLPDLLDNLQRHTGKGDRLLLTWAVRGQAGTRHVSCRDFAEVMNMVIPLGFSYLKDETERWRDVAGEDLWWFKKSIYLFQKK